MGRCGKGGSSNRAKKVNSLVWDFKTHGPPECDNCSSVMSLLFTPKQTEAVKNMIPRVEETRLRYQ